MEVSSRYNSFVAIDLMITVDLVTIATGFTRRGRLPAPAGIGRFGRRQVDSA